MTTATLSSVGYLSAQQLIQSSTIRPISDLRTHLAEIETEAKSGTVVLNRNGSPALVVLSYDEYLKQSEMNITRQKIHDAEMWDRACGGKTYELEEILANLESDKKTLEEMNLIGAYE